MMRLVTFCMSLILVSQTAFAEFSSTDKRIAKLQHQAKWVVPILQARLCLRLAELKNGLEVSQHHLSDSGIFDELAELKKTTYGLKQELARWKAGAAACRSRRMWHLAKCLPSGLNQTSDEPGGEPYPECIKEPILTFREVDGGIPLRALIPPQPIPHIEPNESEVIDTQPEPSATNEDRKGHIECQPRRSGGETCHYVPDPSEQQKPTGN